MHNKLFTLTKVVNTPELVQLKRLSSIRVEPKPDTSRKDLNMAQIRVLQHQQLRTLQTIRAFNNQNLLTAERSIMAAKVRSRNLRPALTPARSTLQTEVWPALQAVTIMPTGEPVVQAKTDRTLKSDNNLKDRVMVPPKNLLNDLHSQIRAIKEVVPTKNQVRDLSKIATVISDQEQIRPSLLQAITDPLSSQDQVIRLPKAATASQEQAVMTMPQKIRNLRNG